MMACIAAVHCLFGLGLYPRLKSRTPFFLQDRDFYADIAANLAAGRGYSLGPEVGDPGVGPHHPTLRRMPAYPLLLAALDRLGGPNSATLFLVQLGLVLAACAWIYRIGARIDHLTGLLAMLLLGAYPQVIVYAPRAYSETLLIFFVCGTLYASLRFLEEGRWRHLAAAAVLAGGAWLTRSTVGLWLVPMAVVLLRSDAARGRRLRVALAAAGIFTVMLAPWVARNWRVSGSFVAGTAWNTRSALTGLRVMTHPWGERYSRELDEMYHAHMQWEIERRIGPVDSAAQEVRESAEWGRLYWEEVRARPVAAILAAVRGFFRIFFQTASLPMRVVIGWFNLMLALLATAGVALAGKEGEHQTSNIEHRTSNIEHRTSNSIRDPELTAEAQRTQRGIQGSNPQSAIRNPQSELNHEPHEPHEAIDPKSEVRNPMSADPNPQSEILHPQLEYGTQELRSEVDNPQSAIRNPQEESGNQEIRQEVSDPQSAIRNPQSGEIHNSQFAIRNFFPMLWWIVGLTYVFYSAVYPLTRYMIAAVPALAVLAAVGGVRLARRWFGSARVDAFTSRL